VAIVNERYVQRFFAGKYPLGQHLTAKLNGEPRDLEIVGIARDTSVIGLRAAPPAVVYVPYEQVPKNGFAVVTVRASGSLADVSSAMRRILQPAVPKTPLDVHALSAQVQATMLQERLLATLAGTLSVLALVLASVGIYGLLAYSVARRTREIGVRMALGALPRDIMASLLGEGLRLTAIGVVVGVALALAATRLLNALLFGTSPTDLVTFASAAALIVTIAAAASLVPALRASRVDPLIALRDE